MKFIALAAATLSVPSHARDIAIHEGDCLPFSTGAELKWDPRPKYMFYDYASKFNRFSKKLHGVLPSLKLHDKFRFDGTKRVAVVSSSPTLLNSGYGELIDQHDIVIRFNFSPTRGYEYDVGSRTDIRIMGRNWIFWEGDEVVIHRYNQKRYVSKDLPLMAHIKNNATNRMYAFSKQFIMKSRLLFCKRVPSSGAMGVALALRLFQNVSIFGFTPKFNNGKAHAQMWHYYNDTANTMGPVSAFYSDIGVAEFEKDLLISSSTAPLIALKEGNVKFGHDFQTEWRRYDQFERLGRLKRFEGRVL